MENQLVVFNLANEHYGVDIATVEGIVKMQAITTVPHTPDFVEGITNLRGEVLPVIDLRKRFGLPGGETTKDTRIVVVEVSGVTVGMVVDAVSEVLRIPEENIEPPSPIVTTVDSAFITSIAKVDEPGPSEAGGRLIILLDLAKVLSTEEQTELHVMQQDLGEVLPNI
ncbi:MAG: chemotaxis protein CheW [Chloroflexota bacterium]|nr:chemotaxis protein CheW [Chloroflexota bacterium]